jgi:transketolase
MPQLEYVPRDEFDRLRGLDCGPVPRARAWAALCRINTLFMIRWAGSGHIGSSFSSLEIVSWLLLNEIYPDGPRADPTHAYFSSKGHDVPGLYAALMGLGVIDFSLIRGLRRLGGLPGHPDLRTPGVVCNTGSLGMGVSKAKGMLEADRLAGGEMQAYVLSGDGELQEGQIWESLVSAVNRGLGRLTLIVDHNKLQSDLAVARTSDLGGIEAKFEAFGWQSLRIDGHDPAALEGALAAARAAADRPSAIIADTIKGKGVSFMESHPPAGETELYAFHSGAPDFDAYRRAMIELEEAAATALAEAGGGPPRLAAVEAAAPVAPSPGGQRLVAAYGQALGQAAERRPNLVVLDADLKRDCGLLDFEAAYPSRFFECGIAEQDMVSMAGGMARRGLLPVVHSFACFLSARPNEQIYNNASEGGRIVYVGSLAGVTPGGPGHSHQAVRDIAALGAVPGLTLVEPGGEAEVGPILDWCLDQAPGSSYIRLISTPVAVSFNPTPSRPLRPGQGVFMRPGEDAVIFAAGPLLLELAWQAAARLEDRGRRVGVVNLPWLNLIDPDWLDRAVAGVSVVVTLDNHYVKGGQGEMIAAALARRGKGPKVMNLGLTDWPVCGADDEVLAHHGLIAGALVERVGAALDGGGDQ